MSELELPRGAQQTLAQMRALDAHVASLKEEFGYDLERVQKALAEARTTYARLRSDVEQRAAQLRSQRKGEEEALAETRALIDALHQDKVAAFDFIGLAFAEALSTIERNQRALDRYLREQDGCTVSYQGIFKGLEDLGRDVIAERDGEIEVIQCKRWAQHKVIHEKHVFQLFGTDVALRIERPQARVRGTFVTTTSLSERAREFARQLDIGVQEQFPLADYPRIKCNVARANGERIYHLPFDQQYDTTVIEPERGERFVATIAEAEQLGFRRAWRWHGAQ
jgi:hypothetical protein